MFTYVLYEHHKSIQPEYHIIHHPTCMIKKQKALPSLIYPSHVPGTFATNKFHSDSDLIQLFTPHTEHPSFGFHAWMGHTPAPLPRAPFRFRRAFLPRFLFSFQLGGAFVVDPQSVRCDRRPGRVALTGHVLQTYIYRIPVRIRYFFDQTGVCLEEQHWATVM